MRSCRSSGGSCSQYLLQRESSYPPGNILHVFTVHDDLPRVPQPRHHEPLTDPNPQQHEIANPAAIPVFLSFFTIIFWTWTSQTAYDMRYQGNDAVNRFFKFIQVGLFIYQGAASGNWNPGRIEVWIDTRPEDLYGAKLAKHGEPALFDALIGHLEWFPNGYEGTLMS